MVFCHDCISCQDCIGCVGLRHKENYLFNKPATKEQITKMALEAKKTPEIFYHKFYKFSLEFPRVFAKVRHCENSSGDYIYNCRDVHSCFEVRGVEAGAYLWNIPNGSALHDVNYTKGEMCFNCMSAVNSKYCLVDFACWDCSFVDYSWECFYSNNLFGCAGLKHGNYQILNKKYSEEEYKKLRQQIVDELIKEGTYGEFFPISHSPFGYNESIAHEYFPLNKEEVLKNGWQWEENMPGTFDKETIKEIPTDINKVEDDILQQILLCTKCKRNFKIIKQELAFYRKHGLPLPQKCFDCRHLERLVRRNPRKLWQRQCMCDKDSHGHSGPCQSKFETSYSPDRPSRKGVLRRVLSERNILAA